MATRARSSEVHAYGFIRDDLKERGWDYRDPSRHPSGQVWTQNECLAEPEIAAHLGLDKPENVVKVSESVLWVIEAKNEHGKLSRALSEAEDYAKKINESVTLKALFVSGVAGNDTDAYLVRTRFLVGNEFRPITINGKDVSALISPEIARIVLDGGPDIEDVPVDEALFLAKAEKINQYLHLGAINKHSRAQIMAALLLALVGDTQPNIDAEPGILISDINTRARQVLAAHNKSNFFPYIEIALPPTPDNHVKFKAALVRTIQELNNLNIRSAMNSGADVLGKFYEVFLKYGNGAKEIGIVLTPRHITKFAVDVLGITDRDVVYDPACGTAGFLVAAYDYVRQNFGSAQLERFKEHNLFGVDQDAEVIALAIVNMIFRGDGKNNIIEGNCFQKNIVRANGGGKYSPSPPEDNELAVSRVLMNPPFALKNSDEKEFRFVNRALGQMQDGGLLFCVLPGGAMVKPGAYERWRKDVLVANNTLLSVITFPEDLFYPVGVHTVGIFVKRGVPHPPEQNVLWIRALNDGLLKSKGKRLPSQRANNDFEGIRDTVKAFLLNPDYPVQNTDRFQRVCPINFSDPKWELVPENYLDEAPPTPEEIIGGIERVVRETMAFQIREGINHGNIDR